LRAACLPAQLYLDGPETQLVQVGVGRSSHLFCAKEGGWAFEEAGAILIISELVPVHVIRKGLRSSGARTRASGGERERSRLMKLLSTE
jgi:hypothetical protein